MSNQRNERFDTLQPGISISSKNSTNGTLGLIVYDKKNDFAPCILSNWHVLAARKFKLGSMRRGANTYQPGRINTNNRPRRANKVGKLVRHNRRWDCAIARITNRDFITEQFETGVLITKTRIPKIGDIVEKSGTRTGVTRARVVGVGLKWVSLKPVEEGNPNDDEISQGGDSGSIWYDPVTHEGLILHSKGENDENDDPEAESASGLILQTVLEKLSVSLVPEQAV
ncbi:MAG: hypothetical protein AAFZ15_24675 [Bacteroidota bacterium]